MRQTIFDTPLINTLFQSGAAGALKLCGWRVEGALPPLSKFVLIAAPHTSNWDFPLMLAAAFVYRVKLYWLGKHTLFRGPFGVLFRWLGGIPIDRRAAQDLVAQAVAQFAQAEHFVLAVPPEGTRQKVRRWKTGFYYIALGAGVPVVLGFLDYRRKVAGFGPTLMPTGDLTADLHSIRAFYANVTGKYPAQFGEAALDPETPNAG